MVLNDRSNPFLSVVEDYKTRADARTAKALQSAVDRRNQALAAQANLTPVIPQAPIVTPEQVAASYMNAPEVTNPGFIDQLTGRAIPQTGSMLLNAGAAFADAFGAQGARDYLREGAAGLEETAAQIPRQVSRFSDIGSREDSTWLRDAGTWAYEELIDQLPILVTSFVGGGAGAIAGRALAGSAAKRAIGGMVEGEVAKRTAAGVAQGFTRGEAAAMARADVTQRFAASPFLQAAEADIARRTIQNSAQAGLAGAVGALETGSAYSEDVQNNGIGNTNPFMDIGVGAINAAITRLLGFESNIVGRLTGVTVGEATEQAVKRTLAPRLGRIALQVGAGASKEGLEEALQEATQAANKNIRDGRALLTSDDILDLANAFAAGALFGGPASVFQNRNTRPSGPTAEESLLSGLGEDITQQPTTTSPGGMLALPAGQEQLALPPGAIPQGPSAQDFSMYGQPQMADGSVIPMGKNPSPLANLLAEDQNRLVTPAEQIRNGMQRLAEIDTEARANVDTQFSPQLEAINTRIQNTQAQIAQLADPNAQTNVAPAERQRVVKQLNSALIRDVAQRTRIENEREGTLSQLTKQITRESDRLQKSLLTNTTRNLAGVYETPQVYQQAVENVASATQFANRQTSFINQQLSNIQENINTLETQLRNPVSPANLSSLRDTLQALKKDKSDLVNTKARLNKRVVRTHNLITGKTPISSQTEVESAVRDVYDTVSNNALLSDVTYESNTGQLAAQQQISSYALNPIQEVVNGNERTVINPRQERSGFMHTIPAPVVQPTVTPTETTESVVPSKKKVAANAEDVIGITQDIATKYPPVVGQNLQVLSTAEEALALGIPEERLNTITGRFQDGTVYISAPAILYLQDSNKTTARDLIARTVAHEFVGHYGLRSIFQGDQFNTLLNSIHRQYAGSTLWNESITGYNAETFANLPPLRQAEEFISSFAERYGNDVSKLNSKADTKTLWNRLKTFLRAALRKVGVLEPSEQDMVNLLRLNYRALQEGSSITESNLTLDSDVAIDSELTPLANTREARALADSQRTFMERTMDALGQRSRILNKAMEKFVDSNHPIRLMIRDLRAKGGVVDYRTNLYKNFERLPNEVANELRHAIATIVDPITAAIAATRRGSESTNVTFARVDDYAGALAALERNALYGDGAAGISNEQARKIIEQNASPEFDRIVRMLQDMNKQRMNILRKHNIIPSETLDAWENAYQYYMPFKDWEDYVNNLDSDWYSGNTRRNLSLPTAQRKITHSVEGRSTEAQSPVLHAFLQLYDTIALSHKVEAGRQVLELVRANPEATDMFAIVPDTIKLEPYKQETRLKLLQEAEARGLDPERKKMFVNSELAAAMEEARAHNEMVANTYPTEKTIAVIDENANTLRILIQDDDVRRALKGDNIIRAQGVVAAIGNVTRFLGRMFTSMNPLFWVTNMVRDTGTAILNIQQVANELQKYGVPGSAELGKVLALNLGKTMGLPFSRNTVRNAMFHYYRTNGEFPAGISSELLSYMSDMDAFIQYGAQTEYFGTTTYELLKRDINDTLASKNPQTQGEKMKSMFTRMGSWMEDMSSSMENMTRYIAFKEVSEALRATRDQTGMTEQEIHARAASIALNLTVNFTRKGSWAPVFNSLYMFSSASIGGSVRVLENIFAKNPQTGKTDWARMAKFMIVPMAAYALQSTLARSMMPDDDDGINTYDKIQGKEDAIILPSPLMNGDYVRIPIPYGFNVLWSLAKNVVDKIFFTANDMPTPSNAAIASSIVKSMFDNFAPLGESDEGWTMFIPTMFRPIVQLETNKNYRGNPIYPDSNHLVRGHVPDSQKYWSTANKSIVWLAETLNSITGGNNHESGLLDVSPESIEHLTNSYLGGMGRMMNMLTNIGSNVSVGNELTANDIPFFNILYRSQVPGSTSNIYSQMKLDAQTQVNIAKDARSDGSLTAREKASILADNKAGILLEQSLKNSTNAINKIRQEENQLGRNKTMPADVMARRKKVLADRKQAIMKKFIKQGMQAGLSWEVD